MTRIFRPAALFIRDGVLSSAHRNPHDSMQLLPGNNMNTQRAWQVAKQQRAPAQEGTFRADSLEMCLTVGKNVITVKASMVFLQRLICLASEVCVCECVCGIPIRQYSLAVKIRQAIIQRTDRSIFSAVLTEKDRCKE